jgi:phosphomannomutase
MVSHVNKSIFRAYDIRGVYGKDLDEDLMERIGNAFASGFVKDVAVVGYDCRNSSQSLMEAFKRGITKAGKDVTDVGLVPRGACLFWAWKNGRSSAYITASHLGKEWNGVKFGHPNGIEFFEEDNYRIRDMVIDGQFSESDKPGSARKEDALKPYNDYISSKIKPAKESLKVVVDCGNGTGGLSAPDILKKLGFDVKALFKEPDGDFPNRPSEIDDSTLSSLKDEVKGAYMGMAFDGDSDRMALMDEKGRLLGPEFASYIILSELAKEAEGPIIANVECLKIMDEVGKKHGRKVHRIRVGNSFMVHEAEQKKACFGVERSGHFCIPSILPMDDGIVASIYAASVLSRSGKKLSEIFDELPQYPFKRMKISCPDEKKFEVIEELKGELSDKYENVNTVDGVRVDFDYGWVLIRASNTEPIIRLSIEADDDGKLDELTKLFRKHLDEMIAS